MAEPTPEQILRYNIVLFSYKSSVRRTAREYSISESLVYKLRRKWKREGMKGMEKRSRAPENPFRKVTPRVETLVIHFKKKLPGWGATRVRSLLEYFKVYLSEPTIRKVWKKHGYEPRKRRKPHGYSENIKGGKKNAYWQVDLLYFDIDEGPLASVVLAIDTYSRYITCARVMERATAKNVVKALQLAFIREGRPRAIVTDNGVQFCGSLEGKGHAFEEFLASKRTVHLRIPFRQPRKNGIVERAVQNVKREALRPFKCGDHGSVQKRLSRWRHWYNFRRRHMGIGNKRPAELFEPYHGRAGYYFIQEVLPEEVADFTM